MRTLVSFPPESHALDGHKEPSRQTSGQMLLATLAILFLGVLMLIVGLSMEVLGHTVSTLNVVMHAQSVASESR